MTMHTNSQDRAAMKCAHCGKPIMCDGDNGGTKPPPCCPGQTHNRTCEPPPRCPDPGTGDVPQDEPPPKVKVTPTRPGQDPGRPPRNTPADQGWFRNQVRGTLSDGPRFGPRKDEYLPFLVVRSAAGVAGGAAHHEERQVFILAWPETRPVAQRAANLVPEPALVGRRVARRPTGVLPRPRRRDFDLRRRLVLRDVTGPRVRTTRWRFAGTVVRLARTARRRLRAAIVPVAHDRLAAMRALHGGTVLTVGVHRHRLSQWVEVLRRSPDPRARNRPSAASAACFGRSCRLREGPAAARCKAADRRCRSGPCALARCAPGS